MRLAAASGNPAQPAGASRWSERAIACLKEMILAEVGGIQGVIGGDAGRSSRQFKSDTAGGAALEIGALTCVGTRALGRRGALSLRLFSLAAVL
jgi:hypothetical protein